MIFLKPSTSNTPFNYVPNNGVPIFNGKNYEHWSILMRTMLIAQDLWDLVQNGYQQPKDVSELASWDDNKKKEYEENQRKDNGALSYIYRGVDTTIFPRIMAATTAKEAWKILLNEFKGSNKEEANLLGCYCEGSEQLLVAETVAKHLFYYPGQSPEPVWEFHTGENRNMKGHQSSGNIRGIPPTSLLQDGRFVCNTGKNYNEGDSQNSGDVDFSNDGSGAR